MVAVLRPDAGEVRFGDHVISNGSESDRSKLRRSDFGILFQFGQLVPELTVAENVALPLLLSGVKRNAAIAAATMWLDRFGVADQATSRPLEMSGGQAQRAAVARAMVTEPSVLFADEPTGALAPSCRREIKREFWKQVATGITSEAPAEAVGGSQAVVVASTAVPRRVRSLLMASSTVATRHGGSGAFLGRAFTGRVGTDEDQVVRRRSSCSSPAQLPPPASSRRP